MSELAAPPLGVDQIQERIPHRHPLMLIDRVLELEEGVRGIGVKCITYSESFFPGHFPAAPIFPGAMIMEAMAQLAALVMSAAQRGEQASSPRYLAQVNRLKFLHPVVPGDRLEVEVAIRKRIGRMTLVEASARVDAQVVATGELSLAG